MHIHHRLIQIKREIEILRDQYLINKDKANAVIDELNIMLHADIKYLKFIQEEDKQ